MYDGRFNLNMQYQQPFMQNAVFQRNNVMELVRVNGMDGARAFQMPPNSTAALFDSGNDIMYIKQTDGAGFPNIRVFTFTEQVQTATTQSAPQTQGVSRDEFDELKRIVDKMTEEIKHGQYTVSAKK